MSLSLSSSREFLHDMLNSEEMSNDVRILAKNAPLCPRKAREINFVALLTPSVRHRAEARRGENLAASAEQ